ncbi:MAG TPA: hypothetical protein PKK10_03485 [Woeseiaceae bacterium]|nr:hypothetical protein [Woeseiaceae bacterium]
MQLLSILLLATAFLLSTNAHGESFNPTAPSATDIIRESHLNSSTLPDGIAFTQNMGVLGVLAEDDFDFAVLYLVDDAGLSVEDAKKIVASSGMELAAIESEVYAQLRELGCTGDGSAKLYDDQVYALFERMYEIREEIANSHLKSFRDGLNKDASGLFKQWLDARKVDTQYVKFNFKNAYAKNGGSADADLAEICL